MSAVGNELVPVDNIAALDTLEPEARELAVTQMLSEARSWLAHAVEATEPKSAAEFKAFIATVAESTKQLNLSKEIQLDAHEMVRRAERGVVKSIRKGQAEGTVETESEARRRAAYQREVNQGRADQIAVDDLIKPKPSDFGEKDEIHNLTPLADATDEEFDRAIAEAKAEGNLSRANVIRKTREDSGSLETRQQRADKAAELAAEGYSSRQIAKTIGIGEPALSKIVRDFSIEVPADKSIRRTRRLDHNRIVRETVNTLTDVALSIDLIDYSQLDPEQVAQWSTSLTESLRMLTRFAKRIKEVSP